MLNLVLFGPPGSGKGTQSERLQDKYGLIHLSTGYLLRKEIAAETALGIEAKKLIDNGQLVPDQAVVGLVDAFIENHKGVKGFLFDGFPRTVAQAEALERLLESKNMKLNLVLALEVPENELVNRLLSRGKNSGRSDDENEMVIRNRFAVYSKETQPVADFYKMAGKFDGIKGTGSVDEIFDSLCNVVDGAFVKAD